MFWSYWRPLAAVTSYLNTAGKAIWTLKSLSVYSVKPMLPVKVLCMLVISIPKVVPDHVLNIVKMSQYYNVYTRDPSKKAEGGEGEGKGEGGREEKGLKDKSRNEF